MFKNVTAFVVAAVAASACLPKSPPASSTTSAASSPSDSVEKCSSDPDACAGRCKKGDEPSCRAQAVMFAERHPKLMRWLSDGAMNYDDINLRPMQEAARRMCSEGVQEGCSAERSLSQAGQSGPTEDTSRSSKSRCKAPTTPVGPYCLQRGQTDETFGQQLTLYRSDETRVWSGVASDITTATNDYFDVLKDYRGNMGGLWVSTRWVRKGDGFEPGPERDLAAEEKLQEGEKNAEKIESAWAAVERIGDDLAIKKFLHAFAVQHTSGARNARAAQRMVEHMAMITKEDYCPVVKDFIATSSKAEFGKRAKTHCDETPPMAGGVNGEQVECRTECRAVFATSCP